MKRAWIHGLGRLTRVVPYRNARSSEERNAWYSRTEGLMHFAAGTLAAISNLDVLHPRNGRYSIRLGPVNHPAL